VKALVPPPKRKQPWRLDVHKVERPVDADGFLRRLAEVLLEVDAKEENPSTKEQR